MTIQMANWSVWRRQSLAQRQPISTAVNRAYDTLVSPRTGLIAGLATRQGDNKPFSTWSTITSPTNLKRLGYHIERDFYSGAGHALNQPQAIISAIGETVERYTACIYSKEQEIVWAAYDEIAEEAIPPTQFALASEKEREQFPHLATFDPGRAMGWVRGRRLPDGQTVLVPATLVYASYRPQPHEWFGLNISTGLAAGPSWEWAVLNGLYECIERDAFMITYLNRLPIPEIDLESVTYQPVHDLLQRIPPWVGCQIRAWNMTLDIDVPAIWVTATGKRPGQTPAFTCSAAVAAHPGEALSSALVEALQCWTSISNNIFPDYRNHIFTSDYSDVLVREDHIGLASQPHFLDKMGWLWSKNRPKAPLHTLPDKRVNSLASELEQVVAAVNRAGLQVLVFDLTTPDVAPAGFHTCRVLIPGAQQLMFGSVRLLGGTRLYQLPHKLGYTTSPTSEATLNPIPHPFP